MNLDNNRHEHFLNRIIDKIAETEKLRDVKQEGFNLFTILRKGSEEEGLHTAFIAYLLDPKRRHGMGDAFLKAYMRLIQNAINGFTFRCENVVVEKERSYENGRVDIILRNAESCIIIENKIYADDGDQQLARYRSVITNELKFNGKWRLVYLNLFGEAPDSKSIEGSNGMQSVAQDELIIQSYESDILTWLKECHQISSDRPTLRESIKQYIFLIERLTGKNSDSHLDNKIDDMINNEPDIARDLVHDFKTIKSTKSEDGDQDSEEKTLAYEKINLRYDRLKEGHIDFFLKRLYEQIAANQEFSVWTFKNELERTNSRGVLSYNGFKVFKNEWSRECYISIQSQSNPYKHEIILGIQAHSGSIDRDSILERLRMAGVDQLVVGNKRSSIAWPIYWRLIHFGEDGNSFKLFHEGNREALLASCIEKLDDLIGEMDKADLSNLTNH